jgi:hypothetical protein
MSFTYKHLSNVFQRKYEQISDIDSQDSKENEWNEQRSLVIIHRYRLLTYSLLIVYCFTVFLGIGLQIKHSHEKDQKSFFPPSKNLPNVSQCN